MRCWRRPTSISGLLGSVAALLNVRTGYEAAVAAALGQCRRRGRRRRRRRRRRRHRPPQGRRPRPGRDAARREPRRRVGHVLLAEPAGRCDVRRRRRRVPRGPAPGRCAGCSTRSPWSTTSPPHARLVRESADVTAVTREGDVLGAHFAAGGRRVQPSLIEVQAAVDEAAEQLAAAAHTLRAAELRRQHPGAGARGGPAGGSTWRSPSCTSPTPRWPPSPRSSASTARRPATREPRPSGSTQAIEAARGRP